MIRIAMKCISILYAFGIVNVCIILNIFGQNLTCTENYAHHSMGRREYVV
jgi:hypothetical protein